MRENRSYGLMRGDWSTSPLLYAPQAEIQRDSVINIETPNRLASSTEMSKTRRVIMHRHLVLIPITGLALLTLAGCATPPNGNGANNNPITKSTTKASGRNAVSNSTGATSNTASLPAASMLQIVEKTYSSSSDAINAVTNVEHGMGRPIPLDPPLNLGLGIKASQLGGSGQYLINWNEGNWTIVVFGYGANPTIQVAKRVVVYLHSNMLPAPQKKGAIFISQPGSSPHTVTDWQSVIAWQEGNRVYQSKQTGDPVRALQTVVHSANKSTSSPTNDQSVKDQIKALHQVFFNPQVSGDWSQIYQESFISRKIGFGIRNLTGGMAGTSKYEIDKTTDGGRNWVKQGTVGASYVPGVSFASPTTGFFLSNSPAYAVTPDVFITHDGGEKWTGQKLPIPSEYQKYYRSSEYPIFFTKEVGIIPMLGFQGSGQSHFLYMLMTADGGTTWNPVTSNRANGLSWSTMNNELMVKFQNQTVTIQHLTGTWDVSVK
jgi:hypothetical protein